MSDLNDHFGGGGSWAVWGEGGSFHLSNPLDRTLVGDQGFLPRSSCPSTKMMRAQLMENDLFHFKEKTTLYSTPHKL